MELEEGMERVQISISVLRTFKKLFHTYREQIPKYYKHSQSIKLWDFPVKLVFQRSDCIMERLLMIEVCILVFQENWKINISHSYKGGSIFLIK